MKTILIIFSVLSIWLSAASANEYPHKQTYPHPDSIIEQITVRQYTYAGGYRLDIYCSDNSHYIYRSNNGTKYTPRIEKLIYESIGKRFRDFPFPYIQFDIQIIKGEEWHRLA